MKSPASTITIRPVGDVEGSRWLQEVQRRTWGNPERDVIPTHILVTLAKNGGLVLGAFAPDGPAETGGMVGFVAGWLGTAPGTGGQPPRLKHCSHIAGVLPEWQSRGVGRLLKLAQRQTVLDQAVTDYVTWTYDPLYRANGAFNLHSLGAISTTYIRNIYGEMTDALNAGVPTDRCQVDWYLRSPRVLNVVADTPQERAWDFTTMQFVPTAQTASGLPQPQPQPLRFDGNPLALPLPADLAAIRQHDRALLLEWRLFLRDALETAFAAGYVLVDCVNVPGRGWYYLLEERTEN